MDKIMATKRIKDLTTTATALDLVSSRYGVIDTPDITKKLPGNLLIGSGSGGGGLFQFVPGTTTFSDILPALEEGKMFVLVHELPSGETSENYYIGVTSNTLNSVSRIVLVNVNQTDMTFYAVDNSDNWTGPSSVSIDASGKVAVESGAVAGFLKDVLVSASDMVNFVPSGNRLIANFILPSDVVRDSAYMHIDASTANPLMNGTAAVGLSTKYAREDHVHPSDASKASASHTHGSITNDGKIGSTADLAVVTGTSGAVTTADLTTTSPTVPTGGTTTSIEFIDTVDQDSKGKISATKKAVTVDSTYSSTGTNPVNGKAIAAAIGGLDSNKTSTDGVNVQVKVTETDGKISAVNVTTDNTENKNNKVSEWQTTPDNTHYPSEKLVKDAINAKSDADKVVAIADARIDRNGTDGWFKIASKAFNSNRVGLRFQWIASALGYVDNSQNVTFFLNLTIGFGSSGSNPIIGQFETSPIKKNSIGCDFKAIVNGTAGNATIELWAKVGSRYGSVAIRELQAGNFRGADAKGFWTYASYSPSDAGSSEEPNGNVSKKLTFVYVQEVIASPTKDNLVAMDANGLVKDSGLAKSSVESAISKAGSAIQGVKVNGTTLTPDANKIVTVPLATKSADGAMSAADKTKLDGIAAGTASPRMDGNASVGNSLKYAREDHVHPSDTSREDIANKTTVVLGTSDSKYPTDKAVAEFVNSSIATNTANYISNNGEPFTSVAQLEAYSGPVTNNDYAFVTGTDSEGNTYYDRYKATVSGETVTWALEYRLNNSSFTAAQWSAINSGITSVLVAKIHDHSNKDVLDGITSTDVANWNGKQNSLTFDDEPTAGSKNPVTSKGIKTAIDTVNAKGLTIKEISGEQVICFE